MAGAKVRLDSQWLSDVRWARNRISKAGEWRDFTVGLAAYGNVNGPESNQADLGSIRGMLEWTEGMTLQFEGQLPGPVPAILAA